MIDTELAESAGLSEDLEQSGLVAFAVVGELGEVMSRDAAGQRDGDLRCDATLVSPGTEGVEMGETTLHLRQDGRGLGW